MVIPMERGGRAGAQPIQEKLIYEMKRGVFRHAERLPRESDLAERLGISRTQLRDSLAELEREGFITRRQGVGTIINRHVLAVKVRTDLEVEFMDMVRQSGHSSSEEVLDAYERTAGADISRKLGIGAEEAVLFVSRRVFADGSPVIYCEDYIPLCLIRDKSYTEADFRTPIFDFLLRFCGEEPYMDLAEIRSVGAHGAAAAALGAEEGAPLLYMDEVNYNIDGLIVLYAPQYFVDGVISHTVMRRKF